MEAGRFGVQSSRNAIDVFALANDGSLSPLPGIAGLPAGAAGLAAS